MVDGNRIRVLIAGNVYVKRALVRRFLEDAGYEVVGDVTEPAQVMDALRAGRPDAVVLDEDLVARGLTLEELRRAAPDVRIVVSTGVTPGRGAPPPGADGYIDKGVGLSALTALLGRLSVEPIPTAAGGAAEASSEGAMDDTQKIGPTAGASRAGVYRAVAIVVGGLLIVWGLVTAITADRTPEGGTVAEERTEPGAGTGVLQEPEVVTELDRAYASLDAMLDALAAGNYVLATVEAQSLMDQREQAIAAGFSVSGLDAEVTARLEAVAPDLPPRVVTRLIGILGSLFPVLEEPSQPGDGSTLVLGTTVTSTTSGGSTSGGSTSGGSTSGGSTGGQTGGGGGEQVAPQPGDGRVWGQWHKEHKGEGGPPPWAKAHGHHN
jgi:CheY-like chemotaxis protein